jgi:carboxymethylenebutenolidase
MGGPIAFRTAAAVPDRVGASRSFHGGGLVNDTPSSPHLQASKTKAHFLVAIAENDDQRSPKEKDVMKEISSRRLACRRKSKCNAGGAMVGVRRISGVYNEPQARSLDTLARALRQGAGRKQRGRTANFGESPITFLLSPRC